MRAKGQTSIHLLLAGIVTIFGVMLMLITIAMSWEPWMVPIIVTGNSLVWILHIGRIGTESFYEALCAGLLMVGFFFFGVHNIILYDIPAVACMLLLVFSMFDKKILLYMTVGLYLLELLYHFFILRTITYIMSPQNLARLGFGSTVVAGAMAIAIYRINKRLDDQKKQTDMLTELETAGRQLLDMIENLLRVSCLSETGGVTETECNLRHAVQEIYDFLHPQAQEKNLSFHLDCTGLTHPHVYADGEKLRQMLTYLVNNAVTYTHPGGSVTITVSQEETSSSSGVYHLTVEDTGVGISPEFLDRIFEPFTRERNSTLSGIHGIGLGLTIAKSIVDRMGGALEVRSEPGQGSTFTATLHLRRQARQAAAGPGGEGLPSLGEGRRILLVEDNEINREIETELLQDVGFTIDEAVNGAIAVEKVRASAPGEYDLILMDIQMPVMDGWQAAQAIRGLANPALASIPIVALSANVFQSDINKSLDSGMEAHLTKPIDIPALLKTIERILKRRAGAGGS